MCIPVDHDQGLVVGYALHGRQVDTGLAKVSDRGVLQRVAHDFLWVEPDRDDDAAERIANVDGMPLPRVQPREQPRAAGVKSFDVAAVEIPQSRSAFGSGFLRDDAAPHCLR